MIDDLEIGTYTLNFTVEGIQGYVQTFEIGITEPPALSAKSSVNQKGKTMTLKLSGSDLYMQRSMESEEVIDTFTQQLRAGMNPSEDHVSPSRLSGCAYRYVYFRTGQTLSNV